MAPRRLVLPGSRSQSSERISHNEYSSYRTSLARVPLHGKRSLPREPMVADGWGTLDELSARYSLCVECLRSTARTRVRLDAGGNIYCFHHRGHHVCNLAHRCWAVAG